MLLHTDAPKILFIHIVKTAGTSMVDGLEPYLKGNLIKGTVRRPNQDSSHIKFGYHDTALQIRENLPDFDDYFKFTTIRNPYDCIYSWCSRWYKGRNGGKLVTKQQFKDWLLGRDEKFVFYPLILKPQFDYIVDENDKIIVDYIARFENIDNDFKKISSKIGIPDAKFPHERKSNRVKDYKEIYDHETYEFVSYYHEKDLYNFDYSF